MSVPTGDPTQEPWITNWVYHKSKRSRPITYRLFSNAIYISIYLCTYLHIYSPFYYTLPSYKDKNSKEGVVAPAGAKVTGATIRTWLLNKFISFLAVLSWKMGWKNVDKSAQWDLQHWLFILYSPMIMARRRKMCKSHWGIKYRSRSPGRGTCQVRSSRRSTMQDTVVVGLTVEELSNINVKCIKYRSRS